MIQVLVSQTHFLRLTKKEKKMEGKGVERMDENLYQPNLRFSYTYVVVCNFHSWQISYQLFSCEIELGRQWLLWWLIAQMRLVCRYAKVGMSDDVAIAFALIAHGLCNLNSAINPVIYFLMSGKLSQNMRHTGCV